VRTYHEYFLGKALLKLRIVALPTCNPPQLLHGGSGLRTQAARRTLSVVLQYVYMRKSFIRRQGGKNVADVYTSWDNLDGGGSIMALDQMA